MAVLDIRRDGKRVGLLSVVNGMAVGVGEGKGLEDLRVQERRDGHAVRRLTPADGDAYLLAVGKMLPGGYYDCYLIEDTEGVLL